MKFLLDTNVWSELTYPSPNTHLLGQFQQYAGQSVCAAPIWHELLYGVFRLPESKRRNALERFALEVVGEFPLLSYDIKAAEWHARQRAQLVAQGLTPAFVDGQIAAIAATENLVLVTRNLTDYQHFPIQAVSWWE